MNTPYKLRLTAIPTEVGIPIDGAGQTLATARDVGLLASNAVFNDSLGLGDPADVYRFSVAEATNISAVVLGLNPATETTIELLRDDNSNGTIEQEEIRQSGQIIGAGGASVNVPAGTYFLNLERDGGDTPYSLTLSPTSSPLLPVDTAGNLLLEARDLGDVNDDFIFGEFVEGSIDEVDFYRFTLDTVTEISLTTTNTAPVGAQIIRDFNENGQIDRLETIVGSGRNGNLRFRLPAGEYFLQYPFNRDFPNGNFVHYNFILTTNPTGLPSDEAGNLLGSARDLGVLATSQTQSDFIDASIDRVDLYRFVLDSDTNLSAIVDIPDSGADPDLRLFRDINGDGILDPTPRSLESIQSFSRSSLSSEFNFQLTAGTYFLEISSSSIFTNGNYNVTIAPNAAGFPSDGAGNTFDMAREVDVLTGESFADFVGEIDFRDAYRFTLDRSTTVDLTIAGQTEQLEFLLVQDINNNGIADPGEGEVLGFAFGSPGETVQIQQTLDPGTYFALVESTNSFGTNYNLDMVTI